MKQDPGKQYFLFWCTEMFSKLDCQIINTDCITCIVCDWLYWWSQTVLEETESWHLKLFATQHLTLTEQVYMVLSKSTAVPVHTKT